MGVQAGASAAVAESALASMYKLRSHGHKHKRELPRFAEKEQGVFSDGLKGAAGKVAAVAKGVAAKVAAVAAPSAAPGGPVGMGMAPINAPVDFPPAGNIGKVRAATWRRWVDERGGGGGAGHSGMYNGVVVVCVGCVWGVCWWVGVK